MKRKIPARDGNVVVIFSSYSAATQRLLSDISVAAVKIGMIPNAQSARIITAAVSQLRVPVVCDPVMLSTSGTQLMADECIDYIMQTLFPLCTLITPNLPEALRLSGLPAGSDAEAMGRRLVSMCGTAFLLKGCTPSSYRAGNGDGHEAK